MLYRLLPRQAKYLSQLQVVGILWNSSGVFSHSTQCGQQASQVYIVLPEDVMDYCRPPMMLRQHAAFIFGIQSYYSELLDISGALCRTRDEEPARK